ncbi:MAG TPA: adenosylcobinamide-GDP ribazoletransferase [Xanthobacteraceae bacterium]|nr:adenosylcobinamide-GDP ribazoletransferase [Xanthobacteraceae bacterium]
MPWQDHLERLRKYFADLRLGEMRLTDLGRAARENVGRATAGLGGIELGGLATDLRVALAFYTRLPMAQSTPIDGAAVARASWCSPIAGVVIGIVAAFVYWASVRLHLPQFVAAALAVAASMLFTGCLHEDGLADTADGFGGATRTQALEIMRDGRIGTFGACALIISFALRVGALNDLPKTSLVAWALIGAHAAARAGLPLFMRALPPARPDGLAAQAGAPTPRRAIAAALLGILILWIALGTAAALVAIVYMLIGNLVLALVARRKLGGQTGDVLGTAEQVGECIVLLTTAAWF